MTYPTSPKHLALFHKFGYRPEVAHRDHEQEPRARRPDRPGSRPRARAPLGLRILDAGGGTKKKALARFHRIVGGICRGMDVSKEVEIVDGLALGDTLL